MRTRVLPALMFLIGIALIVRTATLGGGVVGYLFGALFMAAGAGRLWLEAGR